MWSCLFMLQLAYALLNLPMILAPGLSSIWGDCGADRSGDPLSNLGLIIHLPRQRNLLDIFDGIDTWKWCRAGVLNYFSWRAKLQSQLKWMLEGQMKTTFWAFPTYFYVFQRWSKGQTRPVGGPDLTRGPPVLPTVSQCNPLVLVYWLTFDGSRPPVEFENLWCRVMISTYSRQMWVYQVQYHWLPRTCIECLELYINFTHSILLAFNNSKMETVQKLVLLGYHGCGALAGT